MADCIDINCDMGESFGVYALGADSEIIKHISSANIACGFHAGDPATMRKTVLLAKEHGVAVGAHPGYPDLQGFGRRYIEMTPSQVRDMVVYQIGALLGFARSAGVPVKHVKPHGVIYNVAAKDHAIAMALAEAVAEVDDGLIFVALAGSELVRAGEKAGLCVASEAFADRGYQSDGSLVPRGKPGALLTDEKEIARRVARMVREGKVLSIDGADVSLRCDTICVHGDTKGAAEFAREIKSSLASFGIALAPMDAVVRC